MKLYILLDDEAPQEKADSLMAAITSWLAEIDTQIQPVDVREGEGESWQLGIMFDAKRKSILKQPLEFLYKQAKKIECEFVVGLYDGASGEREDVCYFGCEEGRPDADEVGLYLGLSS